jgi:hypothetical protein
MASIFRIIVIFMPALKTTNHRLSNSLHYLAFFRHSHARLKSDVPARSRELSGGMEAGRAFGAEVAVIPLAKPRRVA